MFPHQWPSSKDHGDSVERIEGGAFKFLSGPGLHIEASSLTPNTGVTPEHLCMLRTARAGSLLIFKNVISLSIWVALKGQLVFPVETETSLTQQWRCSSPFRSDTSIETQIFLFISIHTKGSPHGNLVQGGENDKRLEAQTKDEESTKISCTHNTIPTFQEALQSYSKDLILSTTLLLGDFSHGHFKACAATHLDNTLFCSSTRFSIRAQALDICLPFSTVFLHSPLPELSLREENQQQSWVRKVSWIGQNLPEFRVTEDMLPMRTVPNEYSNREESRL